MRTGKSTSFRGSGSRVRARGLPLLVVASVLLELIGTRFRSGRLGGNLVVRCHQGHLFTTLWIPAASIKSLRIGWWRLQRCPVGHHLAIVSPINEATLTEQARRVAAKQRDIRLP
ncbi:MAG: hypothetical protein JOZ73_00020 [Solirubrobacterales bacterium]|nr:hypothetical protein [Solirubrobacterales bacterium]